MRQRVPHHGERRLHADRGEGADHDDHERRGRQQRVQARALEHRADQHGDQCEDQTDDAENVQGRVL